LPQTVAALELAVRLDVRLDVAQFAAAVVSLLSVTNGARAVRCLPGTTTAMQRRWGGGEVCN